MSDTETKKTSVEMGKDEGATKDAATAPAESQKALSELDKAKAERDEYLAGWQRAKADFSNAQKRHAEDLKAFRAIANEGLIEELLPVLQSFEMAFSNKEAWEKADKGWRAGVEYIYTQLRGVLESNGLKEVNPIGQKFDVGLHEAVKYQPTDDASKEGVVLSVVEKGYTLGGKLVKPAKVVVAGKE